jgi:hypothetical protein
MEQVMYDVYDLSSSTVYIYTVAECLLASVSSCSAPELLCSRMYQPHATYPREKAIQINLPTPANVSLSNPNAVCCRSKTKFHVRLALALATSKQPPLPTYLPSQ